MQQQQHKVQTLPQLLLPLWLGTCRCGYLSNVQRMILRQSHKYRPTHRAVQRLRLPWLLLLLQQQHQGIVSDNRPLPLRMSCLCSSCSSTAEGSSCTMHGTEQHQQHDMHGTPCCTPSCRPRTHSHRRRRRSSSKRGSAIDPCSTCWVVTIAQKSEGIQQAPGPTVQWVSFCMPKAPAQGLWWGLALC